MSEADEYGPGGDRESGPQSEDAIRDDSAASRPFHERFWWLPVATVAAGCLALTGVLVWLAYFGALSHG